MKFDVFSLIPEVFGAYLGSSILSKAIENELISVDLHDIRGWAEGKHHITDEPPYGGGGGMVMKPDPVFAAVESVVGKPPACPVILLTPQGRVFRQADAQNFAKFDRIALICGRYEGFDERIREHLVTDEISIGDYVLTGGELPALTLIDCVSRMVPGVLSDEECFTEESHFSGLLEYPQYTRPAEWEGRAVPEVLLTGHHANIARWRREQSLLRTKKLRPDMFEKVELDKKDKKFLEEHGDDEPVGFVKEYKD